MSCSSSSLNAPSRYAPIALYQQDPEAWQGMLKIVKQYGIINALETIGPNQIRDWVSTFDDLARAVGFLAMDGEAATAWCRFWLGPRQIFDISGPLVPEFESTDVDDVPLGALREPYPELYIHFGPNTAAIISYPKNPIDIHDIQSFRLDGAYIRVHREERDLDMLTQMDIRFTTKWVGRSVNSPVPAGVVEPVFEAEISGFNSEPIRADVWDNSESLQRLQTVGEGIEDGMKNILHSARESDAALREHVLRIKPRIPRIHGVVSPVTLYEDHASAVQPILTSGIRLVVNALFFLSSYPQDQRRQIDPAAPRPLVRRIELAQSRAEASSAEAVLRERGFSYVTLVSNPVEPSLQAESYANEGPGAVKPHLRRGHWRHQRVGPKLSSIRLTWIRPAFVGSSADGSVNGRAYIVTPPHSPDGS